MTVAEAVIDADAEKEEVFPRIEGEAMEEGAGVGERKRRGPKSQGIPCR